MYLYSKHSIKERLLSNPSSIFSVSVKRDFDRADILGLLKQKKISFQRQSNKDLERFIPGKKHQGIVAKVSSYSYANLDSILQRKQKPHLMILRKIQDPQNLGIIIRTLACFGGIVLCLTKHQSCFLTESVIHVASGGENYVSIGLIQNFFPFLKKLKSTGYRLVGTVVEEGRSVYEYLFSCPSAVILGSEHSGLEESTKQYVDDILNIPMKGVHLSLNVNNAASIMAYEMSRPS